MEEKTKLHENFKKLNNFGRQLSKLEEIKSKLEVDNKDNDLLMSYISILEEIAKLEKKIEDMKKNDFYQDMLLEDMNGMEGKYMNIKLKKPYYRTDFNTKLFFDENQPGSKLYDKYVYQKEIAGNVTVTKNF